MSEEKFEEQQQRLWAIEQEERDSGMPLLPVAIVATVLAILGLFIFDECLAFRVKFAIYGPSNSRMSPFAMTCSEEAGICSCTEQASELRGGLTCTVEEGDYEPNCY